MSSFNVGGSKSKSSTKQYFDPNMQPLLDKLGSGMDIGKKEFISSGGSLGALDALKGQIGSHRSFLDREQGKGITQADINARASQSLDPNMIKMITDANANMLGSTNANIAQSANMAGGAGGSRMGIAQGMAAGEASQNLTNSLTQMYSDNQSNAYSQLQDEEARRFGLQNQMLDSGMQSYQTEEMIKGLQRGDVDQSWMNDIMNNNPEMLQIMMYGQAAGSVPIFTKSKSSSGSFSIGGGGS
ncbi:hypothetical protein RGQ13_08690 [Thalassotalea psychrophila]|uniref:Uncharacterized protein n=1 Tax=Thalassotalea psychrophila TaxID=3065647 RepID=A0ABY9TYY4_9GAMM|nr:hypothetical protein RGQ13_08690 [Colwelliaceae bacterium SQ149]